ncbi:MAG: hypothetical protein K0Q95_3366 [Bacteroidota bacterium]|jgi:hypothetical protein|nr:hypothetical protein [Bacteroidota bacterium]
MAECKDCGTFTDHIGGYCKPCYFKLRKPNNVTKVKFKPEDYKLTEGEEFIVDFLKHYNIKSESQKKIHSLKGDTASYRVADFYLPKYDVYLEFEGQWNVPEKQERYKVKKDLYYRNGISCIYLYPENLGILPFVFDKRIQEVLTKSGKTKQLRSYQFHKLYQSDIYRLLFIVFFALILILSDYKVHPESNLIYIIFFSGIIVYQGYKLASACYKIFFKKNYPLNLID